MSLKINSKLILKKHRRKNLVSLNKELIDKIINITTKAALSTYKFVGKNDKINADKAATDSMRNELNKLELNAEVVIGEGELDEAPMLIHR